MWLKLWSARVVTATTKLQYFHPLAHCGPAVHGGEPT